MQAEAFRPVDPEAMAALAARRDRSPTPPDAVHYDASAEVRTRGTGFYAFSKDEAAREEEMRNLEAERAKTEAARREREEKAARGNGRSRRGGRRSASGEPARWPTASWMAWGRTFLLEILVGRERRDPRKVELHEIPLFAG